MEKSENYNDMSTSNLNATFLFSNEVVVPADPDEAPAPTREAIRAMESLHRALNSIARGRVKCGKRKTRRKT